MTKFPAEPVLTYLDVSDQVRILAEDHVTEVSLFFGMLHVEVTLKAGFITDGASVPAELQPAAGSPWAMPRLLAAVVHDGLYQLHWMWRWLCDRVYLAILRKAGYPSELASVEYAGIRAVGWKNWETVSPEERLLAKDEVIVRMWRRCHD